MINNIAREKLRNGETVYGTFVDYSDGNLAELLGLLGWDFLAFDAEHGILEARDLTNLSRACELRQVTPIVRTPGRDPQMVNRYLEAGAHGVMFPMINSGAQAEEAVQAVKYPPRGNRGLAAPRVADFGLTAPLGDYIRQANRETLVITQVETREGIDTLDQVLDVEGIDVVFVGPVDLSTNLGLCSQLDHPEVKGAIERIARAVVDSGKVFGIFAGNREKARYVRDELGARFIATYLPFLIIDGSKAYLKDLKAGIR